MRCVSNYKKDTVTQRKQLQSAFIRIIRIIYVLSLLAWLQVPVFGNGIETRASLVRFQIPMPHNQGLRISTMQIFEQTAQGKALGFCPGVGRLTILGKSADITHPDGVSVMVLAVCPYHFFRSARFDRSIRGNHIVIATTYPIERTVIAVNVCHSKGTARLVGRAVHDNQRDCSHKLLPSAPPAAPLMSNSMNLTT